jgi:hypothetical protein
MTGKRRALLYVYIDTHFVELFRIAQLLSNSGRYDVTFFFEYHYGVLGRDLKKAQDAGFTCLDKSGNSVNCLLDKFNSVISSG